VGGAAAGLGAAPSGSTGLEAPGRGSARLTGSSRPAGLAPATGDGNATGLEGSGVGAWRGPVGVARVAERAGAGSGTVVVDLGLAAGAGDAVGTRPGGRPMMISKPQPQR
jgi:hypothetical protein